jgi:SAM-dependent methyltransferase
MRTDTSLSDLSIIYNRAYFEGDRELSFSRIKKTILLLGDVKGKKILDLGCGTAEGSILLRELGARVVCVDIAKFATFACLDKKLDGILAMAHKLPFRENSFDGTLFMDVIEHIPRSLALQTLFEIKRVTKPNGKIAIHTMPHLFLEKLSIIYGFIDRRHWRRPGTKGGHVNTYTPWRLKKEIRSTGLEILQFEIGMYPSKAPFSAVASPLSRVFRKLFGNDFWVCCSVQKISLRKAK